MNLLNDSRLYQRLQAGANDTNNREVSSHLQIFAGTVAIFANSAQAISDRVAQSLPQFTLHDHRHLWNVLRLMEQLAGPETIERMSPLECGIAIIAAFSHDLGMAISANELDTLSDPSSSNGDEQLESTPATIAWRTYFDGHALAERIREARAIAAVDNNRPLNRDEQDQLNRALGQIRADYVRESHAREEGPQGHNRIEDWMKGISQSDEIKLSFGGIDISRHLALLAMSHGQSVFWLSERLCHRPKQLLESDQFVHKHTLLGQEINWAFLSWLLRLADVMDFDASRTPAVLFDHIGIRDPRSRVEWQKHLSISEPPRFGQGSDARTLQYNCQLCPHPRVEKAIRDMIHWINVEIDNVRGELLRHRPERGLQIQLPSRAEVVIQSRQDGYLYQDLEFQLRRESIIELLMGESLYGEPGLALRELVQNALDAVQLRDLRNQLWAKLPAGRKPADMPEPHQPWEANEKPQVWVSWGEEHGRKFIRVKDNGVGMTLGAMRRFLTQIGKSYYKSDTYRRERELMRRHGLICTPISQFGIGFLSAFMLADQVTIRTRPAGAKDDYPSADLPEHEMERQRFPLRAEIDGPHGLIAVYPDETCVETGTEVTLWLKTGFELAPWDQQHTITWLKHELYGMFDKPENSDGSTNPTIALNPVVLICLRLNWPLYPITFHLDSTSAAPLFRLDDSFHVRELLSLRPEDLVEYAKHWHFDEQGLAEYGLRSFDWIDDGPEGTGSRIRLVLPVRAGRDHGNGSLKDLDSLDPPAQGRHPQRQDIQVLVDPQLPGSGHSTKFLVNSCSVPNRDSFVIPYEMAVRLGAVLTVDLRGIAAPRLTADRNRMVEVQIPSICQNIQAVQRRWYQAICCDAPTALDWLEAAVHVSKELKQAASSRSARTSLSIRMPAWRCQEFLRECASGNDQRYPNSLSLRLPRVMSNTDINHKLSHIDTILHITIGSLASVAIFAARNYNPKYDQLIQRFVEYVWELEARGIEMNEAWSSAIVCHLLSDAFWPRCSTAMPGFVMPECAMRLGDLTLVGPLNVSSVESQRDMPDWLNEFDIAAPLTGIPLGALREKFGEPWNNERFVRLHFMVPFFFGDDFLKEWDVAFHLIQTVYDPREHGIDSLRLFLPGPELWHRNFADVDRETWAKCSASALLCFNTKTVRFADGIQSREYLREHGLPLEQWFKESKLPRWDVDRFLQMPHHTQDYSET